MKKSTGQTGAERRQHPRFKTQNILQIARAGSHEAIERAPKLIDVSEGGLRFYSNESLKKGERIRVTIGIREFNSSVSAFARVVWTQASTEHRGASFAGAEFVGMKETDKDMIRRLEKSARVKKS